MSNNCDYYQGMQVVFKLDFTNRTNSTEPPKPEDIEICFTEFSNTNAAIDKTFYVSNKLSNHTFFEFGQYVTPEISIDSLLDPSKGDGFTATFQSRPQYKAQDSDPDVWCLHDTG